MHRRLRPEEFGGHVEAQRLDRANYPFHSDLFNSSVLDAIFGRYGTHLLPIAFPEGSPLHTAYGSGHATVAGACVTMLKAFFDGSAIIRNPVVPDPSNPAALIPYVPPVGEPPLTVEGRRCHGLSTRPLLALRISRAATEWHTKNPLCSAGGSIPV